MPELAASFEDVWFVYDTAPVLREVSFDIERGDAVSVVGPNGSGKTTLLRLMLGLLQPTRGRIRVFGEPPLEASRRVGYVPQQALYDPKFPVEVLEVVLMGRLGPGTLGRYRRADREAARRALAAVGLEGLEHRAFSQLSGGQRQRALIARALAADAELLMLDEPAAHVDRAAEQELYGLLERLAGDLTLVIVSHDLGVVWSLTDKVICVNETARIHPTASLTGDMIQALYGHRVDLVRHRGEPVAGGPRRQGSRAGDGG